GRLHPWSGGLYSTITCGGDTMAVAAWNAAHDPPAALSPRRSVRQMASARQPLDVKEVKLAASLPYEIFDFLLGQPHLVGPTRWRDTAVDTQPIPANDVGKGQAPTVSAVRGVILVISVANADRREGRAGQSSAGSVDATLLRIGNDRVSRLAIGK